MIQRKYRRIGLTLLLPIITLALVVVPVRAAGLVRVNQDAMPINATIYLTTGALQPIFQSRVNQQVPGAVSNVLATIVNKLPTSDRTWAGQMASTLIQPSATLNSLTPQQNGLATSLHISLYPGDPQPIDASLLVKFSLLNSSTIQVSAQPDNGSPALVSGPLATFQIPLGQLNAVKTTPSCGASALAVNLQFPLSLGQSQQASISQSHAGLAIQAKSTAQAGTGAYVEIPATSLTALGNSIGTITVSSNLTAKNIRLTVQGSNLVITSDIYLGFLQIASATTYVLPTAANGSLAVNVQKTDLTFLQVFTFPNNTYNQQIEQILNAKLNGALAGKLNVTNAAIGANSYVPCAASDSLILTGTTSLI